MIFPLGQVVATPSVLDFLNRNNIDAQPYINRHAQCDWGDLTDFDKQQNDEGLTNEGRLFSSYQATDAQAVWIITEADRSVTTVLLPSDY